VNTPGKPLRWIALPWGAVGCGVPALLAGWHALLADEAVAPHLGQRPDFSLAAGYSREPDDHSRMPTDGSAAPVPLVKQNDNLPGEQQP